MSTVEQHVSYLALVGDAKLSLLQSQIIESCLARGDSVTAKMHLADWGFVKAAVVSRFWPGEHYYALGEKFADLDQAKRYIAREGYSYGGLKNVHVYSES